MSDPIEFCLCYDLSILEAHIAHEGDRMIIVFSNVKEFWDALGIILIQS